MTEEILNEAILDDLKMLKCLLRRYKNKRICILSILRHYRAMQSAIKKYKAQGMYNQIVEENSWLLQYTKHEQKSNRKGYLCFKNCS